MARAADTFNADRPLYHLGPALLRKPCALVARFSQIEGYKCLSLTRALDVVKCQLALA